ncbi:hypothetical protein SDC9_89023 [bioreactor metagenome]|uniref:Uncharacterized protein n=1 Tax=bioreactor metagenome TaxID=1076179 RepID=A0A644ZPP6_9ZZZZ
MEKLPYPDEERLPYLIKEKTPYPIGGADKKLDFSMILDQDSCGTQEGSALPRTF